MFSSSNSNSYSAHNIKKVRCCYLLF